MMADMEMADTPNTNSDQQAAISSGTSWETPIKFERQEHDLRSTSILLPRSSSKPPIPDVRPLSAAKLKEVEISSIVYAEHFYALQLKSDMWDYFFTGILKVVRNKHIADLKRATTPSIKKLTFVSLRGYGPRVWGGAKGEEWLRALEEGEKRLTHVRNGTNERLHLLFEALWMKMRDTIFTAKTAQKKRGAVKSRKSGCPTATVGKDNDDINYEGDADTELNTSRPTTPFDSGFRSAQPLIPIPTSRRLDSTKVRQRYPALTIYGDRFVSADATEEAILELTVRLQQIRANSQPEIFLKLWEANVMRVQEAETTDGEQETYETTEMCGEQEHGENEISLAGRHDCIRLSGLGSQRTPANLSNEPFLSHGAPAKSTFPVSSLLPPRLPETMTVYISESPSTNAAYRHKTYTWGEAPMHPKKMAAFFQGLDLRTDIVDGDVRGWTLSYGFDDMCRWIENDDSKKDGWETFQRDLKRAAGNGVEVWRMKVLVVGR